MSKTKIYTQQELIDLVCSSKNLTELRENTILMLKKGKVSTSQLRQPQTANKENITEVIFLKKK